MPIHTKSFNVLLLEMGSTGKKEKNGEGVEADSKKKENRLNLQAEFNNYMKFYTKSTITHYFQVWQNIFHNPLPPKKSF